MAKILKCDDAVYIENMDEGVANKLMWQWVEKTVDVDLSKYLKITRLYPTITTITKLMNVENLSACCVERQI